MIISIKINGKNYTVDETKPLDISIPLKFDGDQPNAYGVAKASSKPCETGDFVGDTRNGGSCNFEEYTCIPHCNGTHTESIGHITKERISIRNCLKDVFIPATLISVNSESPLETNDTYPYKLNESDELITKKMLSAAENTGALIIRTLPNDSSKLRRQYGEYIPPFFSNEAIDQIQKLDIKHLLVDMPSIDRIFDDGKLSNHRKFWNVEEGKFETNKNSRINSTITELIYVPNETKDGNYLLNLQIAAFESDASPSRPVLFELK